MITYADLTGKCEARTAKQIKDVMEKGKKFNKGLYLRSLILKQGVNGKSFCFYVPLSLMHPFWGLSLIFPPKRLLTLAFSLNPASKMLIKPDSLSDTFAMEITSIHLDLSYVTLEQSFRSRWYELIEEQSLVRTFVGVRETHFVLQRGSSVYYLNNITPYGSNSQYLKIMMIKESVHVGCFKNPYVYKPFGLKTVAVFINGNSHYLNAHMRDMDLSSKYSVHVRMFYHKFLQMHPKSARSISLDEFFSDMFIFCIDLSPKDLFCDEKTLSLITPGTNDLHFEFSENITENLIVYVHACHESVASFSSTGELR